MANDGKELEGLVAFVEKTLLPQGFQVTTNKRIFDEDGVQIAEFDVEVRGKVGSTDISWLIECRDRPGQGAAPGAWVEQLVGRRDRFGFNKVTAVSTTGFAAGAVEYAKQKGIELREVKALSPDQFSDWLAIEHMAMRLQLNTLKHARILVDDGIPETLRSAAETIIAAAKSNQLLLRACDSGAVVSVQDAFGGFLNLHPALSEGLEPNGEARAIRARCEYTNDGSHFLIETPSGNVRVRAIYFDGEIKLTESYLPIEVAEYGKIEADAPISQVAAVKFATAGTQFALELHRIPETGLTHVIMRSLGQSARD